MTVVAADWMTCPECVGKRVVINATADDPLGNYAVCPKCCGGGQVRSDTAADAIQELTARLARNKTVLDSRERHIALLHTIRRAERANAFVVAQNYGYPGTYHDFCNELFEAGRPKPCGECARPLPEANA